MSVPETKRRKELEIENARLKKLLAESLLEYGVPPEVQQNCVVRPPISK